MNDKASNMRISQKYFIECQQSKCNQSMKLEVVAYQRTNNQYCNKFDFFHSEKIYALAYNILQRNVF